jgi:hypothetical protein
MRNWAKTMMGSHLAMTSWRISAASGSDGQKGEDKVIDGEKERRHRLRIAKTISATPSHLVRLLLRSGSPSSVSSIVGLDLTQEYCAFIFKKLTDATRQWGLDIERIYDTKPQQLSDQVITILSETALQVRWSSFMFFWHSC